VSRPASGSRQAGSSYSSRQQQQPEQQATSAAGGSSIQRSSIRRQQQHRISQKQAPSQTAAAAARAAAGSRCQAALYTSMSGHASRCWRTQGCSGLGLMPSDAVPTISLQAQLGAAGGWDWECSSVAAGATSSRARSIGQQGECMNMHGSVHTNTAAAAAVYAGSSSHATPIRAGCSSARGCMLQCGLVSLGACTPGPWSLSPPLDQRPCT
jgi:hypothetical protein